MAFRAQWRSSPIFSGPVEVIGPAGGGGSRPSRVRLPDRGCSAFAKKAFSSVGVPEAAHEFLASELGNILNVPVPPVGFWWNNDEPYALSIRAFPEPITWGESLPNLTPADHQSLYPVFSRSCVFHTWIADVDHFGHPGNLAVDARSPPGGVRISFIDHAFAFTHSQRTADAPAAMPPHYYMAMTDMQRAAIAATIERVNDISRDDCKALISRVPADFLPQAVASMILDCLMRRAKELTLAFGAILGG